MAKDLNLYSCLSHVFKSIPSNWEYSFTFTKHGVELEPDADFDAWLPKEKFLGTDKVALLVSTIHSFNQGLDYGRNLQDSLPKV